MKLENMTEECPSASCSRLERLTNGPHTLRWEAEKFVNDRAHVSIFRALPAFLFCVPSREDIGIPHSDDRVLN